MGFCMQSKAKISKTLSLVFEVILKPFVNNYLLHYIHFSPLCFYPHLSTLSLISRLRKKKQQKIPGAKLPTSLSGTVNKWTISVSEYGYKNYRMASGTNFGSMQRIAQVSQIPAQNRQNSFVVQKTVST